MSSKEAQDDDSEEALIAQFETTLTIRASANDDDVTMASYANQTSYMRDMTLPHGLSEESDSANDDEDEGNNDYSEFVAFRSTKQNLLRPDHAILYRDKRSKSPSPAYESVLSRQDKLKKEHERWLKPSPLIDESLDKFRATFAVFLKANPQIEKESPKFANDTDRTIVILSPYSTEHAFGRKWVTKSYLATIFERPQRMLASCLGVAAAVTMYPFLYKITNSTKRSSIFSPHVLRIHGKTWPRKLFDLCLESHEKLESSNLEVPEDWNTGDIYLNPRTINALEGVIGTVETAIESLYQDSYNLAFTVIRPPGHHSHACLPSGFCLINNVQIGIEYAYEKFGVSHVAILDIDLHHGDGSQDICWERAGFTGDYGKQEDDEITHNNPRDAYGKRFAAYPKVGYFSLHDIKSYPTELGYATRENIKNASTCVMDHDLNIWNVHLQAWANEDEFYKHYSTKYVAILNRANQFLNHTKKQYDIEYQQYLNSSTKYNKYMLKPHLYSAPVEKPSPPKPFKPLIVISAGFDASEYENPQMQRHGVNVPTSFYATFSKDVVKLSKIHKNCKILSVLEGGYSDGALATGIFSHLIGFTNNINEDTEDSDGDELLWNHTWGSEQVMREIVKGCKKNWTPYRKPNSDVTIWANEVIKLGRAMMPNSILSNSYIYEHKDEEKVPKNRMTKDLVDPDASLLKYEEDKKVRHTRSYFKKLASAQKQQAIDKE